MGNISLRHKSLLLLVFNDNIDLYYLFQLGSISGQYFMIALRNASPWSIHASDIVNNIPINSRLIINYCFPFQLASINERLAAADLDDAGRAELETTRTDLIELLELMESEEVRQG